MLYKHSHTPTLSKDLFKSPPSEYRGAPFWAWNDLLTREELLRQIEIFKEMGLGGFHMHVRTGLKNPYLDDDFMALIKACVEKAKDEEMLAYLYDEDRWPSGAAGGLVTKEEKYRARCLLFTNAKVAQCHFSDDSRSEGGRSNQGKTIAVYDVMLDDEGRLLSYRRIPEDQKAQGEKWYAISEIHQPSSWYNNQTYVDTLNAEAIRRFIEVTHERYKESVGAEFDKTVPSIFTDEPQFTRKQTLQKSLAEGVTDVTIPWTDLVPEGYFALYGEDILDTLPEIFWEKADGELSLPRYRYHDYIAELFAKSFADTVGTWCRENGIALTGHMMEEPSLRSQTAALGEAMRSYRSFGIPGIDLLCNHHEFTTAKQAQSAARQYGSEGVLSELYGVTGWDADFRLYKHQGDWQAALGITLRVPHLSWYAMKGEAKRDYPASISYQSPWYKEYSAVEDHFARVNAALTRGKAKVKVAVVHPVESYWLRFGPEDQTGQMREDMDERFLSLTRWLLEGNIDFDFISESLFPSLCETGGCPLKVGKMEYTAVIVPDMLTMRSTTLSRLSQFKDAGGHLIFLDEAPKLIDAIPSEAGKTLFDRSDRVKYERNAVLSALKAEREIEIRYDNGRPTEDFLYQRRADTDGDWLFIAHTKEPRDQHLDSRKRVEIHIRGEYAPQLWDTENGEVKAIGADYKNGETVIKTDIFGYDSLLYKLIPGRADAPACFPVYEKTRRALISVPASFEMSEDNILVLDMARYALDGDAASDSPEEILRLDNICRENLGFPRRENRIAQPWVCEKEELRHTLHLQFTFLSETEISGATLALEDAPAALIRLNGNTVKNDPCGYFVDIAIDKIPLPEIKKGENVLEVTLPFGKTTSTENMFLLGRFGVRVQGAQCTLTPYPEKIAFGDLTTQGFPFYSGEVRYRFPAQAQNGSLTVKASHYNGALIGVYCDGKFAGRIIYPPYELKIENLSDGPHEIELRLFLHRYNTFGALHITQESNHYHWPGAWRTRDEAWAYEYVLRRVGILKAPEIFTATK